MKKIPDISLKAFVFVFFCQMPVQTYFLIPLMELTEILAHEQELFAGMAEHKGISRFQVGKFVTIITRHFVDHGTF